MSLIALYFALALAVALIALNRGRSAWRWFLAALFVTPLIAGLLVMAFPRLQQRAYARTEWDAPPIVPEVVPMPLDSVIRVIRPRAYTDRGEFYEIFVNGAEVATVDPDTITDIPVPTGRLSVEIYADWGGSEPLIVETSPRRRVDIQVSNPWGPGLALWTKFIRPGRYLRLTEVEDVPAGHPTLAYAAHPSAVRP